MLDTTSLRFQIDELERRQIFTSPLVKQMLDELEDCIRERDALSAYVVAQGDEIERLRKIVMRFEQDAAQAISEQYDEKMTLLESKAFLLEKQRDSFSEKLKALEKSVEERNGHSIEEHRLLLENVKLRDAFGVKALEAKEAHEVIHDIIATLEQCGMVSRHRLDVPI